MSAAACLWISSIVGPAAVILVHRFAPPYVHTPFGGMPAWIREVAMYFRHASLFHKRDAAAFRRPLGIETPAPWLKPDGINVLRGGLFDVRRHGVRPAKDYDQVDCAGDIGQTTVSGPFGDGAAVRMHWNHVVPGAGEILQDSVAVPFGARAGTDNRHGTSTLQQVSQSRFFTRDVRHGFEELHDSYPA
jgi:hypothetical protein